MFFAPQLPRIDVGRGEVKKYSMNKKKKSCWSPAHWSAGPAVPVSFEEDLPISKGVLCVYLASKLKAYSDQKIKASQSLHLLLNKSASFCTNLGHGVEHKKNIGWCIDEESRSNTKARAVSVCFFSTVGSGWRGPGYFQEHVITKQLWRPVSNKLFSQNQEAENIADLPGNSLLGHTLVIKPSSNIFRVFYRTP